MSKTGRIKIILKAVHQTDGTNQMLAVKASDEVELINKIGAHADGNIALFLAGGGC